jgi:xanthine dehydrogenase accessory factor
MPDPPYVQATVVRAQHPSSAHAGDTAVVLPDGRIEGFVGGACAESSVQLHGLQVLETGEALLLRILPGAVETTAVEDGAVTVSNPCLSGGALEIFLEPRRPAPRVLVVGDTPTARALAQLGEPLGLAVEALGDQTEPPRSSDAALVVASHGRDEEHALEAALRAGVPYVGLVASRIRGAAVLAALDAPAQEKARVHSPAGLDIGARSAPEIALSILAEIIALRTPTSRPPPPATAVDPICGMTVPALDTTPHLTDDGQTIYFCSDHCRAAYASR